MTNSKNHGAVPEKSYYSPIDAAEITVCKPHDLLLNYVELPPGEMIEVGDLVDAIVKAIFTVKTEGLTGLECITGKLVNVSAALPAKNNDLDFDDEPDSVGKKPTAQPVNNTEHSPQLELPIQKVEFTQDLLTKVVEHENSVDFSLPNDLTDHDRKQLKPLLCNLPPLTFPMSDNAISEFLDAYLALPNKLPWVPTIITQDTISRRLEERSAATEDHKNAIRQAIEEGKLSACDTRRVPRKFLSIGTLIPRSSALEYLKRYGLSVKEVIHPAAAANECERSSRDEILTASGDRVLNKKETSVKWTDEELEAIIVTLNSIDPETQKKYTNRKVADLIGLKSAGRITQLTKMFNDRRKKPLTVIQSSVNELIRLNKKR